MNLTLPEYCIGVRVLIPVGGLHAIVAKIAPDGNYIASLLVDKLLKAELALDGIEAIPSVGGPLNQLMGFIFVDDLEKGLLVVERVFSDVGLNRNLIEIAWWDHQERRWQLHPYGNATEFNQAFGDDGFARLTEQIAVWAASIKQDSHQ